MSRADLERVRDAMLSTVANRVYLYRDGDECAALTGGWTNDYQASLTRVNVTKAASYMQVTLNTPSTMAAFGPNLAVDMTNYGKLYVDVEVISVPSGATISVRDSKATTTGLVTDSTFGNTTGRKVVELDISSITGNKFIRTAVSKDTSANGNVKFYNYWME